MPSDNRLLPLPPTEIDRPLPGSLSQAGGYYGASLSTSDQAQLRDYLNIVLKRKWLILTIVVIITSMVAIYMFRQPSIYEAKTTLRIERKMNNLLQTKNIIINTSNSAEYWNTQLKLLENPKLLRQVILALNLQSNPAFLTSAKRIFSPTATETAKQETLMVVTDSAAATGSAAQASTATTPELTMEQLARLEPYEIALRDGLTIEPVERTNLVEIKFRHTNPQLATLVATTLASVFINNDVQSETQGTQNAINNIGRQIVDLQQTIRQQEEQRIDYLKRTGLPLGANEGQNLTATRLGEYSKQLLEAEKTRKNLQSAVDAANNAPDIWSVPEVRDNKAIQDLRVRISTLEEKRAQLLVEFTLEWPEVKEVEEQIKQLRTQVNGEAQEIVRAMRSRLEAAVTQERKLSQSYFGERTEANQMSQSEIFLSSLNQQIETNKKLFDTLFQRQKELEVNASDRTDNVTVTTPARVPTAPVGPPRVRITVIALLLTMALGIGLAIMLDMLDDSLNTVEDVDRYIQLPTLALIPTSRTERAGLLPSRVSANKNAPAPALLSYAEDARSPVGEAFRHLRTSLLFSSAGQPPKTILVTSGQPSEGKSTVAANTAIALAQTGAEVLLIDCDLRRPRVHSMFGVPNTVGVINHLSGNADVKSVIQRFEQLSTLSLMTSGTVPPNPAELLGSAQMAKMLTALSADFAHIVIDSPPVVSFTDAAILSTLVDGVVLVTHGGKSSRAIVKRAKKLLNDVGARIYGVVLNNVKLKSSSYYYYGGYNYAEHYAAEED